MIKVGLDIGNSKISCVVCDIKNDNSKKILSFISTPTNCVKKSIITDLEKIKIEINDTIEKAAKESQTKILSINLNIPVVDSLSKYSQSAIDIDNEKISELHVKKAINNSDFLDLIDGYDIIYQSILSYELDNNLNIDDPKGMYGNYLKVNFYKFAVKKNFIRNMKEIFGSLNIQIENFIPLPLSSSLATISSDDRLLGTICIDLGSSSTSVAVFENDKLIFADSIKVGGINITNDLARKFTTTIEEAERLKTLYGSVISSPSDEHEVIDVPLIGSSQFKQISISDVNSIIKPRVEETLELIWQKLKNYNIHSKRIKNIVLTGGGSLLEGIDEYAQFIFDSNVRIGYPRKINGLNQNFFKPQFSQTIGIIFYDKDKYEVKILKNKDKIVKNTFFSHFSTWLDKYI